MESIHNMIIHQMDVETAFLNGEVVKESSFVCMFLYVDDMLIFGSNQVQVELTKEFLSSKFSMKDMRVADVILGIRIKHESNRMAISQSYYIEKVLKKFNYFDCTLVSTSIDTSEKVIPNNGQTVSQLEYSKVIGCLMYVMTCTRPGIAFAVDKLTFLNGEVVKESSFVYMFLYVDDMLIFDTNQVQVDMANEFLSSKFSMKDMGVADVIIVSTSMDTSEKLMPNNVGKLSRYTSNLGTKHWQSIQVISNTEDNSSTSGWVFMLGEGASKKQTCITGSRMESKFVALAAADKEAKWLRNLILEIPLWSKLIALISIRCDSAATLAKAYSKMYNGKSRHLGVRHSMIVSLSRMRWYL
ncbi:zinc finger, CCHC-type containing protein [Tanacetum coccineum]